MSANEIFAENQKNIRSLPDGTRFQFEPGGLVYKKKNVLTYVVEKTGNEYFLYDGEKGTPVE